MKVRFIPLIKQLFVRYDEHEVSALGAQMTYYIVLAFFPFLLFVMTLISYTPITSEDILIHVKPFLATDAYVMIEDFVSGVLDGDNRTVLSFGMIGTIWASSTGVKAIIRGLNKAYDMIENRPFWKVRGIAILLTLGLGAVILISLAMLIFGQMIGDQLFKLLGYPANFKTTWNWGTYLVPLFIMFIVFIFMYRRIPNRQITFREALPGAAFSTLGWVITSILFAYYVNNWGHYTKIYGSIGGIIVLLIWLYISSIITLLGGEVNAALFNIRKGNK
jgi:membrane protein